MSNLSMNKEKYLILIVEDEVENNRMLAELLTEEGYSIYQVYSGQEALDYLENNNPSLIILDLMLPDIDGFSICKKIKSSRKTNIIPIIMLTALSDFKNMVNGIKVGANKYITKPFEVQVLLDAIKELLEQRNLNGSRLNHSINFTLNSQLEYLTELNNMISVLLAKTNFSEEEIEDIKSGIYEIAVNAIEWGNKFNKSAIVKVDYEIYDEGIKIVIEDEGSGFNFKEYLSGDYKPINEQDERLKTGKRLGGFGIIMAKKYFDKITYNESGNKAYLEKYFKNIK